MKGLTINQLKEITEFLQEHHHFAKWISDEKLKKDREKYPKISEFGLNYKYMDTIYDTRDGTFWSVSFRVGGSKVSFRTNTFTSINPEPKGFSFDNLYDWIMAYLKGEWNNETILKQLEEN